MPAGGSPVTDETAHTPDPLPSQFRKWTLEERRTAVTDRVTGAELDATSARAGLGPDPDLADLADVMVESAVGYLALPLGICRGVLVDGMTFDVPMATEEPSVIAAATYAAGIIARAGGFTTRADDPITTGQIFIEGPDPDSPDRVRAAEPEIRALIAPVIERMERRGGGFRGMDAQILPETGLLRVQIHVDVRDAMGANIVNTAAEAARPLVERVTGGRCLMAILTNAADRRLVEASFRVPVSRLARAGLTGELVARRVQLAGELAQEDPSRAVTHNKGIMNGITAVTIATGNDNRAVEAAVHQYASRSGRYRGLATYRVDGSELVGTLTVPIALGTVGGAAGLHPSSRLALALLGRPSATLLARIAVSVGLAQNLAAVMALVTEGIQSGHMALHARRLAWMAGARGTEREAVAQALVESGTFNVETARAALETIRKMPGAGGVRE
jgi:hydroxymethylglutaryl-CoA reductase